MPHAYPSRSNEPPVDPVLRIHSSPTNGTGVRNVAAEAPFYAVVSDLLDGYRERRAGRHLDALLGALATAAEPLLNARSHRTRFRAINGLLAAMRGLVEWEGAGLRLTIAGLKAGTKLEVARIQSGAAEP